MAEYLVTYRPLCVNGRGRKAIANHQLPPFVDASCRREPDFQSAFPSISAICRLNAFAPRLRKGDRIAYITTKGRWFGATDLHWRLVAFLEVWLDPFPSHADAAAWYASQNQPPPSNCLVKGNLPQPLNKTALIVPKPIRALASKSPAAALRAWDNDYQRRARQQPVFVVCNTICMDLVTPRKVTAQDQVAAFGRIPVTRTPPCFMAGEVSALVNAVCTSVGAPP